MEVAAGSESLWLGEGWTLGFPLTPALSHQRLCRKSVHGSTGSPRTDGDLLKINYLAVRPEPVEGRQLNCDTVSQGGGDLG